MVEKRLDIAFATSVANYFAKNSGHQYMEVIKIILKYVKETKD